MSEQNIIVLGAGYGGITAALRLARLFRSDPGCRIYLIDRNHYHTLKTQLHEAAVREVQVSIPIERLVRGLGIEFERAELTGIDPTARRIQTTAGEFKFDYLIVALGSQANFYGIPGLERYSMPLQSLDDARAIHAHILDVCRDARAEPDTERRAGMLRFVIGGAGLSGVEFAAELAEYLDVCLGHDSALRSEATIIMVEGSPHIVPQMKEAVSRRIQERLSGKGVESLTETRIIEVKPDSVALSTGRVIRARTVVWTGGIRVADLVRESGLRTGALGRVIVDRYLMADGCPGVYAIGDSALAMNPATGAPVPAAAQFAL